MMNMMPSTTVHAKAAADLLVEKIEGNARRHFDFGYRLLLYRHYVELKLKYIITALDVVSQTAVPKNLGLSGEVHYLQTA